MVQQGSALTNLQRVAVAILFSSMVTTGVAQTTESSAGAFTGNGGPSCVHDSLPQSGPTRATCSAQYSPSNAYVEAGVSAASTSYSLLSIGGNASVLQETNQFNASAGVNARSAVSDVLTITNIPSGSYLSVVFGMLVTPTGSDTGYIISDLELQPVGEISTVCTHTVNFGADVCPLQIGVGSGDIVNMSFSMGGTANATCNPPSCGAAASGFQGSAKVPGGGGRILVATIVDGSGNHVKGATITTASGHKYPTKFASTTALSSDNNPSTFGASVTFTATVTSFGRSSTPTGKVTFHDTTAGTTLGTAFLSGGIASYATSSLSIGTHGITASYSGDSWSNGSHSSALDQVVQ